MQVDGRQSLRLRNYNYSLPGYYFITICTQNKTCLFGTITNDKIQLNESGVMIAKWWREVSKKFSVVQLEDFVIMPNHIHGILVIREENTLIKTVLQTIIQWFKTMTTNEYIQNVKQSGWKRFSKRMWQRNYYEHIIRNEKSLEEIREYIIYNPYNWKKDELFV
ncbi:MAG: transposase [Gammaproteobacteria bacterium]